MPRELLDIALPNMALPEAWMHKVNDLPEDARPLQCLLRPGQILIVPSWMWHATYNVGHAIGVGFQRGPSRLYNTDLWKEVEEAGMAGDESRRKRAVDLMKKLYQEDPYYLTNIAMYFEMLASGATNPIDDESKSAVREMIDVASRVSELAKAQAVKKELPPRWASLHILRLAETLMHFSRGDSRAASTVENLYAEAEALDAIGSLF